MEMGNLDFVCLSGSHLYGVANENSDKDWRGFYLPEPKFLWNIKGAVCHSHIENNETTDRVIWTLQEFINLCLSGNTNSLEILWSPNYTQTDIGKKIVNIREAFISDKWYRSIMGFATGEFRKMNATRLVANEEHKDKLQYLNDFASSMQLKSFERDKILELVQEMKPDINLTKIESNIDRIGDARKALIDKHGFDVKSSYHAIRLLGQLEELIQERKLTFPRPDFPLLSSIRSGHLNSEQVNEIFQLRKQTCEMLIDKYPLPKSGDLDLIVGTYGEIVKGKLLCSIPVS